VETKGRVFSIERIEGLVTLARKRYERLGIGSIGIIHGDGINPDDVPAGPFDMITCAAGCSDAPDFWKQRLSEGGRMVFPKQTAMIHDGKTLWSDGRSEQAPDGWEDGPLHTLCKTTRTGKTFQEEFAAGFCRYVPLLPEKE
jgi:protein-L-isoaspartate O-methyltransferase